MTNVVQIPKAAPRITRILKVLLGKTKAAFAAIGRYLAEGAEIHNRTRTMMDERYERNWYWIRGLR